jgi:hypothetical protein
VLINHEVNIVDSPRFRHRGVMLDTSRHFLPVPIIKKNLVNFLASRQPLSLSLPTLPRLGCDGVQQVERLSLASG